MPEDNKSGNQDGGKQAPGKQPEPTKEPDKQTPGATMSQEQLDEIIKGRVDRAKEKALSDLAKKQGYDSIDQMVEAATKAKEKEESEKSEIEKLTAAKTKAERDALDAQTEIASTLIKAEFKVMAAQKGVIDPEAAYFTAQGLDMINATVNLDTKTVKGIDKDIDKLIELKPFLKGSGDKTPVPSNQTPLNPEKQKSGGTKDATDQMLDVITGQSRPPE